MGDTRGPKGLLRGVDHEVPAVPSPALDRFVEPLLRFLQRLFCSLARADVHHGSDDPPRFSRAITPNVAAIIHEGVRAIGRAEAILARPVFVAVIDCRVKVGENGLAVRTRTLFLSAEDAASYSAAS